MQFSHRSGVTWDDYLLTEYATSSLRTGINSQTQSLVASNDRMNAALDDMGRQVSDGLAELGAAFDWRMSEVLLSMGGLADSLEQLIALARNPSQTWAYEQFNIAREAYRRHLIDDALTFVTTAIEGNKSQTGYRLDHRFHMLVGLIRLGNQHTERELINLDLAEQAFLDAAKYATKDAPDEAGRAMLSATWAAYCAKRIDKAEEHARKALEFDKTLPEAHFLLAKLHAARQQAERIADPLATAIRLDRGYMLKVDDDPDFEECDQALRGIYGQLVDDLRERYDLRRAEIETRLQAGRAFHTDAAEPTIPLQLAQVDAQVTDTDTSAEEGTYYALGDALEQLNAADESLTEQIAFAAKRAQEARREQREDQRRQYMLQGRPGKMESQEERIQRWIENRAAKGAKQVAWIAFAITFGIVYTYVWETNYRFWNDWYDPLIWDFFTFLFYVPLGTFPVYAIAKAWFRDSARKEVKDWEAESERQDRALEAQVQRLEAI